MTTTESRLATTLSWMRTGTEMLGTAVDGLDDRQLREPSALPGWSRAHVIAHVAANADALGNLVHWARTGVETPMYASLERRNAEIESGAAMLMPDLRDWFFRSADDLSADLAALTADQWGADVRTVQGRTVPASELPWIRSREVLVHSVDLAAGATYDDLPPEFLSALIDEICDKRSSADEPALVLEATDRAGRWSIRGSGEPVVVRGTRADLGAYLSGRDHHTRTENGAPAPELPRWL
jgi:maleylpyruvate isomerase